MKNQYFGDARELGVPSGADRPLPVESLCEARRDRMSELPELRAFVSAADLRCPTGVALQRGGNLQL
jgi:hypothetical protein